MINLKDFVGLTCVCTQEHHAVIIEYLVLIFVKSQYSKNAGKCNKNAKYLFSHTVSPSKI